MKKKPVKRSREEKAELLAKVDGLVNEGKRRDDALKQVGINKTQYYSWRSKGKAKELQEVLTFPLDNGRLVIVAGLTNEVLAVLERLNQLK